MGGGVEINATPPKVVLYDITGGGKVKVGATVEVVGSTLTYIPAKDLMPLRRFLLEVRQSAVNGGEFLLEDISEKPQESIPWKRSWWASPKASTEGTFHLRFSTLSHPRLTSAYQENDRIHLIFSQAMDRATTTKEIQLLDAITKKAMTLTQTVWPSALHAYIQPATALSTSQLYKLKVGARSLAADKTYLDGNDNGKAGEADDDFCAKFTGFQKTIFSRLGATKRVPCS